jgi:hypothetical protein
MNTASKPTSISTGGLWHLPVVLVLAIYLPAAAFGAYVFRDQYAVAFLALLAIFTGSYYLLYPPFSRVLTRASVRHRLWNLGDRVNWLACAWVAVSLYVITIAIASFTTTATPLGAALGGASLMEIADARAALFAKRQGSEALLRYSAVILGRSVMPFLVAYLYWSGHRWRHLALAALLLCYGVSLEKAGPVFAFLPLVLMRAIQRRWRAAIGLSAALAACLALWTVLAMGLFHDPARAETRDAHPPVASEQSPSPASDAAELKRHGDPRRHYVFNFLNAMGLWTYSGTPSPWAAGAWWIVNRAVWIPYITAYDWLKFHDDVLDGRLTLGRSIGIVSWLLGQPRLQLEQMVYAYQFGASPAGAGASNTVFFVEAKLAFGWLGAIAYCLAFPFFAAAVFSSANDVAKIASVTSFFTAALSPLTATLLSGGLFFYVLVSLLTRLESGASRRTNLGYAASPDSRAAPEGQTR